MSDIKIEIKVFDSDNGLDFTIPISSDSNSPLSINKELSDINNLTSRKGVQSRKFKIPLSKDISSSYLFFNQSQNHNYKKVDGDKDASLLVNGQELERGKVRVVSYSNKDGAEEAELLFFGDNFSWTELIKNKTLADITWTNNSVTYSPAVIKASWANTVDNGDEWVFPLENRGGRKNSNSVHTEDFRPALFFYKILEKILLGVGYTFESTFMNTDAFKKLIITHFGKNFKTAQSLIDFNSAFVGNKLFTDPALTLVSLDLSNSILDHNFPVNVGFRQFDTPQHQGYKWIDNVLPFNDVQDNFDPTAGTARFVYNTVDLTGEVLNAGRYTASGSFTYKFKLSIVGFAGGYGTGDTTYSRVYYLRKFDSSGNLVGDYSGNIMPNQFIGGITDDNADAVLVDTTFNSFGEISIDLKTGETVEVWYYMRKNAPFLNPFSSFFYGAYEIDLEVEVEKNIVEGAIFNIDEVVDDNVKVLDLINDVSRLFNLMWTTDSVLKKITVEPRDDFYGDISDAVDFTDRVDISKTIETRYNSQTQKQQMNFAYANDSSDVFVTEYNRRNNIILGEYDHNFPDNFREGTETVKCKVLAASYPIKDLDSTAMFNSSLAPWTTMLWKEFSTSTPLEMIENNAPRLLNYVYGEQLYGTPAVSNSFRFYDESADRTTIPYCLPHVIETEAPAPINLYWHTVSGTNGDGLFTTYWAKTSSEISSGINSSLSMLFDQKSWLQFKFRDIIYLDEPIDIKGYWVVEKLDNYQPENSGLVKVKLLKRVEYDASVENVPDVPVPSVGNNNPNQGSSNPVLVGETNLIGEEVIVNALADDDGLTSTIII